MPTQVQKVQTGSAQVQAGSAQADISFRRGWFKQSAKDTRKNPVWGQDRNIVLYHHVLFWGTVSSSSPFFFSGYSIKRKSFIKEGPDFSVSCFLFWWVILAAFEEMLSIIVRAFSNTLFLNSLIIISYPGERPDPEIPSLVSEPELLLAFLWLSSVAPLLCQDVHLPCGAGHAIGSVPSPAVPRHSTSCRLDWSNWTTVVLQT